MFSEAEDKNFLPSKPVVKLLQQDNNFLCIVWLCESKGTYVNTSGFKACIVIFTLSHIISWDTTVSKKVWDLSPKFIPDSCGYSSLVCSALISYFAYDVKHLWTKIHSPSFWTIMHLWNVAYLGVWWVVG